MDELRKEGQHQGQFSSGLPLAVEGYSSGRRELEFLLLRDFPVASGLLMVVPTASAATTSTSILSATPSRGSRLVELFMNEVVLFGEVERKVDPLVVLDLEMAFFSLKLASAAPASASTTSGPPSR